MRKSERVVHFVTSNKSRPDQRFNSLQNDFLHQSRLKAFAEDEIIKCTVFLLINAPRAMQNIVREPLFCTQFAKQKVCPIDLYPYDITFVNKYQLRCILGCNGGNRCHIVVD